MGHAERIIAELESLDEAEQARLLAYVEKLKAERSRAYLIAITAAQARDKADVANALARFRVSVASYRFDRKAANTR